MKNKKKKKKKNLKNKINNILYHHKSKFECILNYLYIYI